MIIFRRFKLLKLTNYKRFANKIMEPELSKKALQKLEKEK